jgi:hypothetical protein
MFASLSLLAISLVMIGCGSKYSDAIQINEEYIDLMDTYISGLDKADSAKDAAKVINKFADGLEKIWPEMQKLSEKYPELKDTANPPEELEDTQKRAEAAGQKMAGAMMKMMPYMQDPEVRKAQERLGAIMMKQ